MERDPASAPTHRRARPRLPVSASRPALTADPTQELLDLQRSAGNQAFQTLLRQPKTKAKVKPKVKTPPAPPPPPTAGWKGVKSGSPNVGVTTTPGTKIKRVPVKGIKEGLGFGNALVLIPQWLPQMSTVEVLLHLHGHQLAGYDLGYESAYDESLYRIEHALDQFAANQRPIIGVLVQGSPTSEFGKGGTKDVNVGAYIQQAIAAVPPDQWPNKTAPQAGGVILSGHSGAGAGFTNILGTEKMPHSTKGKPGELEGLLSFDTINAMGEKVSGITAGRQYKALRNFVIARLDADLRMLNDERSKATGKTEAQIQTLQEQKLVREGFRFRAFYTGTPHFKQPPKPRRGAPPAPAPTGPPSLEPTSDSNYADRYFMLARELDAWFASNEQALGGQASKAYKALRANYTIEAAGTSHMKMLGGVQDAGVWTHENLKTALVGLPTVPQAKAAPPPPKP